MLAIWGLITILGMIVAIVSRRMSPLVALFLFPVTACLALGFGLKTAQLALSGLVAIAPVVAMFLFAILFFGVLTDAGTIEPFVRVLLRGIAKNPVLIVPGTALLALLLHLDGSGAVVFLVAIPTLLPLYQAGVNFLPWTGPTIRVASALHTSCDGRFSTVARSLLL